MRIDNVSTSNIQGPRESAPRGLPEGLRPGDTFEARVVRSEGGSVTLRMADGQLVEARLEGDVRLPQGQTVRLSVSDVSEGTVRLAQGREGDSVSLQSGVPVRPAAAPDIPPALRPYAEALRQQGLPVSGENLAAMGDFIAQNPALSLRQAAFLAGNRVSQEPAIMDAATGLLEGGAKVGDLLARLTESLNQPLPAGQAVPEGQGAPQTAAPGTAFVSAPPIPAQPQGQPPVTWASLLAGVLGEALPAEAAAPAEAPPLPAAPGIPQAGQEAPPAQQAPPPANAPSAQAAAPEVTPPPAAVPPDGAAAGGAPRTESGAILTPEPQAESPAPVRSPVAQALEHIARQSGQDVKVEPFARVLEGAARELETILTLPQGQQAAGLESFVKGLFARIDRWGEDTPQMVQRAREELLPRLSLLQEALTTGGGAQRPEAAQQTQRLMDHLRLLGQIEQFTYMQLPIQQGERQQTAEVYIYQNKKKSRRIDPENVRILLALDLEHMGHIQAFVAIRERDVSMRLDVEQSAWADFFRSQTVTLHSMLSESGYRLLENRVQVADTAVTVESAIEALGLYEDRPAGLDFTI